jgi:hypothetical protein
VINNLQFGPAETEGGEQAAELPVQVGPPIEIEDIVLGGDSIDLYADPEKQPQNNFKNDSMVV